MLASIHRAPETPLYVHVDLDVLDVAEGRANEFAVPGGVSANDLVEFCKSLRMPAALTLSAYDPSLDEDSKGSDVAIRAVETLLGVRSA